MKLEELKKLAKESAKFRLSLTDEQKAEVLSIMKYAYRYDFGDEIIKRIVSYAFEPEKRDRISNWISEVGSYWYDGKVHSDEEIEEAFKQELELYRKLVNC